MTDEQQSPDYTAHVAEQEYWDKEFEGAEKYFEKYFKRVEDITKVYRDEKRSDDRRTGVRMSLFWSNIQTLGPALYTNPPKPIVERTNNDPNPVSNTASEVMQRVLKNSTEGRSKPFDRMMRAVRDDYLLFARGVAWVRGEYKMAKVERVAEQVGPDGMAVQVVEMVDKVTDAKAVCEFVHQKDFMHQPARKWDEVEWVAKCSYMSKKAVKERFGEDFAKDCPFKYNPAEYNEQDQKEQKLLKNRAKVWEVWCKSKNQVVWYVKGAPRLADIQPPPIQYDGFFPCPEPCYGTMTNDTLVPVPDYIEYQDQLTEINELTRRIHYITKSIKANGLYNAATKEIARIFDENKENELVPVQDWGGFAGTGGSVGNMQFLPVETFIVALNALIGARQQAKNDLYEISGLSDIVRGQSNPNETAAAQSIKSRFASLRISDRQMEIQRFARDAIALMAEVVAETFPTELLAEQSGIGDMSDPVRVNTFQQAVDLLRDGIKRNFKVDIETDSTIALDKEEEKKSANELVQTMAVLFKESIPLVQAAPEMLPVVKEIILRTIRVYTGGRNLESVLETAFNQMEQAAAQKAQQPPQPDPKVLEVQAKMQKMEVDAKNDTALTQADLQLKQLDAVKKQQDIVNGAANGGRPAV